MPRDTVFIAWNFAASPHRRPDAVLAFSTRWSDRLPGSKWGTFSGYGSVKLPFDDPRLPQLLRELNDLGVLPHPRVDREYTAKELDAAEYLVLNLATVGLSAGANVASQEWNRRAACPQCGAGSEPLPPLWMDERRQPASKALDHAAHDGSLIATAALAKRLSALGLTGFEPLPVRRLKGPDAVERTWMRLDWSWPPVDSRSRIERGTDRRCVLCDRSSHYEGWAQPNVYVYSEFPTSVHDFAHSYEYYGVWHLLKPLPVGGARLVIVTQKARRALLGERVRRIRFVPLYLAGTEPPPLPALEGGL